MNKVLTSHDRSNYAGLASDTKKMVSHAISGRNHPPWEVEGKKTTFGSIKEMKRQQTTTFEY